MKPSKFNFKVELDSGNSILLNTFSGAIDNSLGDCDLNLLSANGINPEWLDYLISQNFLVPAGLDESSALREIYGQLLAETRRSKPLHCVIIVSFDCNLQCTYCWQQHKLTEEPGKNLSLAQCDAIFCAIESLEKADPEKSSHPPIVQLFGGEPLLLHNRETIEYLLKKCREREWLVQITTNGATLGSYLELIERYQVHEIQITVDGFAEHHDRRRVGSSYEQIMDSIGRLLQSEKAFIKIRSNVDADNLAALPLFAKDIIRRQWYTSRKFMAYLAPLRDACMETCELLGNRVKLLEELLKMRREHPEIEIFEFLGWDGYQPARRLENTGKLPFPRTNICETNLKQFVFSPSGEIHVCAEEAHDPRYQVGRFWPSCHLDMERFSNWYDRGPLDIKGCQDCNLLPICGGGCQLFDEQGVFRVTYCQTVRESFLLGLKQFFEEEHLSANSPC
jgi:uncharacterized protein